MNDLISHRVYKSINKPLTIWGVERRLFFLALIVGAATFNFFGSLGGGLVMIGGPDTFGAGGWQGSKLEEVLPVNMDIPAQRQLPKGALVLVMHLCEMPDGNYWGEQCAIKALETLSERDEIGVISA